ncbi:hypothetical protein ACIF9R_02115 [Streptomyces sp. NPDC086080]|uniref:hypothetical protein n=1 Tax=Streptomyces sp. NPDC086080 TaxID=3365748 RepID=UPI0037CE4D9E
MPWRGEGLWTVDWFAIPLFILGPVYAGAAAVDASRLSRPGNIHLVVSVARLRLPYLRAAAWCAVPAAAVHLLAIVIALVTGGVQNPEVGWGWMVLAALVQCLAIAWYVALGSAIGRFAPPVVAGLSAAAGAFVLFYLLGEGSGAGAQENFQLLTFGGATVSRLGLTYDGGYLLGQAVVLPATAAAMLLLPLRMRSGVRVPTGAGSGLAAVTVAVLASTSLVLPAQRLQMAPQTPQDCVGSSPQVCLFAEHSRFAGTVNSQFRDMVDAARDAGYDALIPDKVEEMSRTYRPAPGTGTAGLQIPADTYETGELSLDELVTEIVTPQHCAALYGEEPPSDGYWERNLSLYATWMTLMDVKMDLQDFPVPVKILDAEQVRDIKADFARCDLDGST